jgi:hypothetical protein
MTDCKGKKGANGGRQCCCQHGKLLSNLKWVGFILTLVVVAPAFLPTTSTVASTKPFDTFEEFYPFYLSQHADETCRRLHFIGTSLVLLVAMVQPYLFPSLVLGGLVGSVIFPVTRGIDHGLIEMLAMFGVFVLSVKQFSGAAWKGLVVLLVAYGFAWSGHFIFEHNKPATFIYPLFSLLGDFRMWASIATGERAF